MAIFGVAALDANDVHGPVSFESLRTVYGILCATNRQLQLIENNTHWNSTKADEIVNASVNQIRTVGNHRYLLCSKCSSHSSFQLRNGDE
jgi:hypothetical protein